MADEKKDRSYLDENLSEREKDSGRLRQPNRRTRSPIQATRTERTRTSSGRTSSEMATAGPELARGGIVAGLIGFTLLLACGGGRSPDTAALTADTATVAGDVAPDSALSSTVFHGVKYPLTSDNYRKWMVAQAALDSLEEPTDMPRIDLRDPTDDDIERTVGFLTNHEDERRAIERAGLSIKDFVLTSVALGQAFRFSNDDLVSSENRAFVESKREELVRVRAARDFHVLDDDDNERGAGKHGHKHHRHGKHKGR